jgi:beta-lactamase regulating signal transducer with metallopeptidase domain
MESLVQTLLSNALAVTVTATMVTAFGRICRRPALMHSLWLVVMLKLVTPPLVPVSLPVANASSPFGSSPTISNIDHDRGLALSVEVLPDLRADATIPRHTNAFLSAAQAELVKTEPDFATAVDEQRFNDLSDEETYVASRPTAGWSWEALILVVVLAGAFGWWALATVRIIRFQRLLKDVQPPSEEWQSHTDGLAERMGLSWSPLVSLVPGQVPPMLWATGGRPKLLVPSKLWAELDADERASLLLHELAHLKRRDHWVRWLELVVAGLYWWHPVVWWARRALREAEEQCCDAWVVWAMPDRARTYAAALLAAVEFVSGARIVPAAASATNGSGHVSCLKRRLRMIVCAKTPKGLSWAGRIAVLGTAVLLLPLAPSWAENDRLTPTEPDQLNVADEHNRSAEAQSSERVRQRADKTVEDRVAEQIKKDPELVALTRQIDTAREYLGHGRDANGDLTESLKQQLVKIAEDIKLKRKSLRELYKKGTVDAITKPQDRLNTNKTGADVPQPTFKTISENRVEKMMDEMAQTDLELIEAQSILEVKRDVYQASLEASKQAMQQGDEQQLAHVREEFNKDPEVLALKRELDKMRAHLDRIKHNVRQLHDPARVAAQNQLAKLQEEYQVLWEEKYPEIKKRLAAPVRDTESLAHIQELGQKIDALKKKKVKEADLFKAMKNEQTATNGDILEVANLNHQVSSLLNLEEQVKKNLDQLEFEASQAKDRVALADPTRRAAEKQLSKLTEQYENLRKRRHDQLLALALKDDDDKDEKARDVAERLQEQLRDLISKLGKELSPVAEEVRKVLERAVGEVHKSLEKEGLSGEDLGKALEKSQEELRKAFEADGPVNKELRDAIEHARKDLQEAFDRARGDVQDQVESLRQQSRELRDQAREKFDRARSEAEKRIGRDGEELLNRDELESARKEIRDLQQQLQRATRRLQQLEQRESRREARGRRQPDPQREARPQDPTAPRAEPAPPKPPQEPARPAIPARPARPNVRRPLPPIRPRGPQRENDQRIRELEDKMNQLLKELENLKGEKNQN